jgi:hypothetical protein
MSKLKNVNDRYCNDSQFQQLVRTLEHCIEDLNYTPSELRDAVMFACLRVESFRSSRLVAFSPQTEEWLAKCGYKK